MFRWRSNACATYSLADVLRCTIENYGEDVYITTPPDTNSSDGQYARIGTSRGIGNRAIVVGRYRVR